MKLCLLGVPAYPIPEFLHLLLMPSTDCALMVTKNGNLSVAIVVKLNLLDDTPTRARVFAQLVE